MNESMNRVHRYAPSSTPEQLEQAERLHNRGHEPLNEEWMAIVKELMDELGKLGADEGKPLDIFKISSEFGVTQRRIKAHGYDTGDYELRGGFYKALWATAARRLKYRESHIDGVWKLPENEVLKREIKKLKARIAELEDQLSKCK